MLNKPTNESPHSAYQQSTKAMVWHVGGCNAQKKVQHHLEGSVPHVFTMQLAWQSNNEKGDDIRQTMNGITEVCTHPVAPAGSSK